ncbi:hypothetical protein DFH11DRAFT_1635152 [Phellopilus nigrolimitatus]|nr:hypothetical protein DFH11DRAFT_1635152 [Phellopilus nigrolimitatus]
MGCICVWLEEAANACHVALVPALIQHVADCATQRTAFTALHGLLDDLGTIEDLPTASYPGFSGLLGTAPVNPEAVTSAINSIRAASFPYDLRNIIQHISLVLKLISEGLQSEYCMDLRWVQYARSRRLPARTLYDLTSRA